MSAMRTPHGLVTENMVPGTDAEVNARRDLENGKVIQRQDRGGAEASRRCGLGGGIPP